MERFHSYNFADYLEIDEYLETSYAANEYEDENIVQEYHNESPQLDALQLSLQICSLCSKIQWLLTQR